MEQQSKTFKVILLGDQRAGKDSFFRRYAYNYFNESGIPAIGGSDYVRHNQTEKLIHIIPEKTVKIKLYRTCGQERYNAIAPNYYNRADGILVLYDTTNRLTFENAPLWLAEAWRKCENYGAIMLIGTKLDLANERAVSYEEGKQFADENEMLFLEVSSKLNQNIDSAMEAIAICLERKFIQQAYKSG